MRRMSKKQATTLADSKFREGISKYRHICTCQLSLRQCYNHIRIQAISKESNTK